jgi:hypothetical protein
MVQSTQLRYPQGYQFFDQNGLPLALGTLKYQVSGSGTLQNTWSDSAGTVLNANPIVLDGSGRLTNNVYLGSTGLSAYKETLFTSTGATVSPWPIDPIPAATGNAGVSTDLSLTLRSGDADLNILTGAGVNLPGATTSLAGLMSAADKVKVNNLSGVYVGNASGVSIKNNAGTPNSKIDCATGPTMMVDGSGNGSFAASAAATIDLTVSGAAGGNCLDTGVFAASQWYHIHQITNGTLIAFLASLSATAPTLPAGYTKSIRIGVMRSAAGPVLLQTNQAGRRTKFTSGAPALGTGAITFANFFPPTSESAMLTAQTATVANDTWTVADMDGITIGSQGPVPSGSGEVILALLTVQNTGGASFTVGGTGATFTAYGWFDRVNVLS